MKRLLGALLVALTVAVALVGCASVSDEVVAQLEGSWKVVDKPSHSGWDSHTFLDFLPGLIEFRFRDQDETIFERGKIINPTNSSFTYELRMFDFNPNVESTRNYATYRLSGETLTVTFYSDPTKDVKFGTIEAVRR